MLNERGLSESVQYAVILPTVLLVTLGIIQAGVWIHGHNIAIRSASAAADLARGSYGSISHAEDMALRLATSGGLNDVRVSVARSPSRVDITVSAQAPLIFDLGLGRISEMASAPVERISTP